VKERSGLSIDVAEKDGVIIFRVRLQARASRDSVGGEWQAALRVRLTAPPVDDRANECLCRMLAAHLNVPVGAVRILSGARSRTKRIEVRGATAKQVRALGALIAEK
jgi:uncharacterized protein (TIGR00251 family)